VPRVVSGASHGLVTHTVRSNPTILVASVRFVVASYMRTSAAATPRLASAHVPTTYLCVPAQVTHFVPITGPAGFYPPPQGSFLEQFANYLEGGSATRRPHVHLPHRPSTTTYTTVAPARGRNHGRRHNVGSNHGRRHNAGSNHGGSNTVGGNHGGSNTVGGNHGGSNTDGSNHDRCNHDSNHGSSNTGRRYNVNPRQFQTCRRWLQGRCPPPGNACPRGYAHTTSAPQSEICRRWLDGRCPPPANVCPKGYAHTTFVNPSGDHNRSTDSVNRVSDTREDTSERRARFSAEPQRFIGPIDERGRPPTINATPSVVVAAAGTTEPTQFASAASAQPNRSDRDEHGNPEYGPRRLHSRYPSPGGTALNRVFLGSFVIAIIALMSDVAGAAVVPPSTNNVSTDFVTTPWILAAAAVAAIFVVVNVIPALQRRSTPVSHHVATVVTDVDIPSFNWVSDDVEPSTWEDFKRRFTFWLSSLSKSETTNLAKLAQPTYTYVAADAHLNARLHHILYNTFGASTRGGYLAARCLPTKDGVKTWTDIRVFYDQRFAHLGIEAADRTLRYPDGRAKTTIEWVNDMARASDILRAAGQPREDFAVIEIAFKLHGGIAITPPDISPAIRSSVLARMQAINVAAYASDAARVQARAGFTYDVLLDMILAAHDVNPPMAADFVVGTITPSHSGTRSNVCSNYHWGQPCPFFDEGSCRFAHRALAPGEAPPPQPRSPRTPGSSRVESRLGPNRRTDTGRAGKFARNTNGRAASNGRNNNNNSNSARNGDGGGRQRGQRGSSNARGKETCRKWLDNACKGKTCPRGYAHSITDIAKLSRAINKIAAANGTTTTATTDEYGAGSASSVAIKTARASKRPSGAATLGSLYLGAFVFTILAGKAYSSCVAGDGPTAMSRVERPLGYGEDKSMFDTSTNRICSVHTSTTDGIYVDITRWDESTARVNLATLQAAPVTDGRDYVLELPDDFVTDPSFGADDGGYLESIFNDTNDNHPDIFIAMLGASKANLDDYVATSPLNEFVDQVAPPDYRERAGLHQFQVNQRRARAHGPYAPTVFDDFQQRGSSTDSPVFHMPVGLTRTINRMSMGHRHSGVQLDSGAFTTVVPSVDFLFDSVRPIFDVRCSDVGSAHHGVQHSVTHAGILKTRVNCVYHDDCKFNIRWPALVVPSLNTALADTTNLVMEEGFGGHIIPFEGQCWETPDGKHATMSVYDHGQEYLDGFIVLADGSEFDLSANRKRANDSSLYALTRSHPTPTYAEAESITLPDHRDHPSTQQSHRRVPGRQGVRNYSGEHVFPPAASGTTDGPSSVTHNGFTPTASSPPPPSPPTTKRRRVDPVRGDTPPPSQVPMSVDDPTMVHDDPDVHPAHAPGAFDPPPDDDLPRTPDNRTFPRVDESFDASVKLQSTAELLRRLDTEEFTSNQRAAVRYRLAERLVITVDSRNDKFLSLHNNLGHRNPRDTLAFAARHGIEVGTPAAIVCDVCQRQSHRRSAVRRETRPKDTYDTFTSWAMDTWGPREANGVFGTGRYYLGCIDRATRYLIVIPMASTNQIAVQQAMRRFAIEARRTINEAPLNITFGPCITSDSAAYFKSEATRAVLRAEGFTSINYTAPYTPTRNGLIERVWDTIFNSVRRMLDSAGLSDDYHPEATAPTTTCRQPTSATCHPLRQPLVASPTSARSPGCLLGHLCGFTDTYESRAIRRAFLASSSGGTIQLALQWCATRLRRLTFWSRPLQPTSPPTRASLRQCCAVKSTTSQITLFSPTRFSSPSTTTPSVSSGTATSSSVRQSPTVRSQVDPTLRLATLSVTSLVLSVIARCTTRSSTPCGLPTVTSSREH
jgi:hypothetical protein